MPLFAAADSWFDKNSRHTGWAAGVMAVPVIGFCALLTLYVADVPWVDDIEAFLVFILAYVDAPTLAQKFDWLVRPNNEHRILTGKLITLAMYALTGVVSFRWLILIAFLFLLSLLALFARVFRSMGLPWVAFVPVPFLLLQPQYYLTTLWAITAMQHQVVMMLVFVGIYLLAGNTGRRFWAALGIQILASLSMSNGLFGWVAGVVLLALQRQWLRLAVWLGLGAGTIVFYFHDFQSGQGNESSVAFFLQHPHLIFFGFFTFTGGLFDFFSRTSILWRSILPTLAGMCIILAILWQLWQMNRSLIGRAVGGYSAPNRAAGNRQKRRYFFTGGYVFLLVNAVVIAFLRPRFGYEVMLISNYMLYPAVLVVLLYLNVLSETPSMPVRWVIGGTLMGLVVWANWYVVNLPMIAYRKQQLLTFAFDQKHNKTGLGPNWGSGFMQLADNALTESSRRGIYRYPAAYYTPYESRLLSAKSAPVDSSLHLEITNGDYSYTASTSLNDLPGPLGPAALIIQSAERTYLFPSERPYRFITFYLNRPVRAVQGEIINPAVAPGEYRLGIFTPSDPQNPVRFSRQTLRIDFAGF